MSVCARSHIVDIQLGVRQRALCFLFGLSGRYGVHNEGGILYNTL